MRMKAMIAAIVFGLAAGQSYAQAEVEVTWEEPESYTDVRPSNETRSGYRKRVFAALESYITEMAAELPEGYKLALTVTDLDLAGQVWPSSFVGMGTGGNDVRVIKRVDIPRMKFSYTLSDGSGNQVKSAEVSIKDMSFLEGVNRQRQSDNFRYEKEMLRDWFNEELHDQLVRK